MSKVMDYVPEAQGDEALYLGKLFSEMSDEQMKKFSNVYRARRKDPQTIMILCILGFLGLAGVHRFVLNQIGMGILYFFTAGLCFIGVIVDLVNYKDLTFQYNRGVAQEIKSML
ncbi:MAG: TM2 domain-containing protein [Balneolaceae bacterium]|nr:TM2 domain-containing protein [Balneolaceae bacterium]MBO6546257.1 TM2 domain-containing protein [Balneolaceae bacterium]MBO6648616.1 TM2 domain-containing protein [Balneolaceae bacterium]